MSEIVYQTIGNEVSLGPLITLTGLTSADVNQVLQTAEMGQPEGARLQLQITNLGQLAPLYANHINSLYAEGKIVYQPTGEKIEAWSGQPIAYGDGSTGILTLRWIKLQWFVLILVGILVGALLTYLALHTLSKAPYTMTSGVTSTLTSGSSTAPFIGDYVNPSTGTKTFYFFYLPWYWDAAIGTVLAVAPWAIHRIASADSGILAIRHENQDWRSS